MAAARDGVNVMSTDPDDRDPWHAEADAFATHQDGRDYDVAAAAELPDELIAHAEAADADPDFQREYDEWFEHLLDRDDHTLLLVIEQSCDDGVLLPWDMRGVRLATVPSHTLAELHRLLEACPRHVLVHLAHYVYWLLRSERARRRGSPRWSPSMPLWPAVEYAVDRSFRPMMSWPSRWP